MSKTLNKETGQEVYQVMDTVEDFEQRQTEIDAIMAGQKQMGILITMEQKQRILDTLNDLAETITKMKTRYYGV